MFSHGIVKSYSVFKPPEKLQSGYYYTSVTPQGQSQGDLEEQNEMGNMLH